MYNWKHYLVMTAKTTKKAAIRLISICVFFSAMIYIFSNEKPSAIEKPKRKERLIKQTQLNMESIYSNDFKMNYSNKCTFEINSPSKADILMSEVYNELTFEQSYVDWFWGTESRTEIDYKRWNQNNILKVFITLHSHNDPGWLYSFEDYFNSFTAHILDSMIQELPRKARRKFIWSEISSFSMWWQGLHENKRSVVQSLIDRGQLEFVTGGWVMNDEASTHWISTVQQMTHGHQWLKINLNYTPVNHWAIDTFGYSATQAILLNKMGVKNMLIQRIHHKVKKEFAKNQNLEFWWRQIWDKNGETDIFTHLMPYASYSISYSCGPNPSVCRKFDFSHILNMKSSWTWILSPIRSTPEVVTDANVKQLSKELLEQLRKKSMLYKTNVVFVPLGDDFTYLTQGSFELQFTNYEKLFNYMNHDPDMYVKIQFGTLADYFNAVHENAKNTFPTFSGDFFPYCDRGYRYWSGYFTTRPFYKRMERELLSYLRAAEIILSLTQLSENVKQLKSMQINDLNELTNNARNLLALFQHHDAITGTSREYVVDDYGEKLFEGIQTTHNVILQCTMLLLLPSWTKVTASTFRHYNIDDVRYSFDSLAQQYILDMFSSKRKEAIIFNSLPQSRREVVKFVVNTPYVEVMRNNERIPCQILPVFENEAISRTVYEVLFVADISALALQTYTINAVAENKLTPQTTYSLINILNPMYWIGIPVYFKKASTVSASKNIKIFNDHTTLLFNDSGLLSHISTKEYEQSLKLEFVSYQSSYSGAYTFVPKGSASPIHIGKKPRIRIIIGSLLSSVSVKLPNIEHTVTLFSTTGADNIGFQIQNIIDIRKKENVEIAMRLSTSIKSGNEFFTDLNGYQVIRRRSYEKIPIQGNFYPMSTMAFLEDDTMRLTLVTDTPLGCASLKEGQLEVMLDRRLQYDDQLGMGEGIMDNHVTKETFRIILEMKQAKCKSIIDNYPGGFPTISAHAASQTVLFPLIRILKNDNDDLETRTKYTTVQKELGMDYTLATLRTNVFVKNNTYGFGIILQRQFLDICYMDETLLKRFSISSGSVKLNKLLPHSKQQVILRKSSLSFLHVGDAIDFNSDIELCPMDIQAYILFK